VEEGIIPVGAGDDYSFYPKSWYDYRWHKFPAHAAEETGSSSKAYN
jgi:hypothetical protein